MAFWVAVLVLTLFLIVASCWFFTNGIEWLGRRLNLGQGAVGSILAAVGTAMPETLIPLIAIVMVGTEVGHEIGIGAILGAPFMLSTLAYFVTGLAVLIFAARGRRKARMNINVPILERDLGYFLVVYAGAVASAFIPSHPIKVAVAVVLVGLYALYVFRTLRDKSAADLEGAIDPLYFSRGAANPHTLLISLQVLVSLGGIIGGARLFVASVEHVSLVMGLSPLVFSLLMAPVATELPEKFNSVIWVRNSKDTLAMGNITGAMVFQSSIPVAIGLIFTSWELSAPALASAALALLSGGASYIMIRLRHTLSPYLMLSGGLFYGLFIFYVVKFL
ncbi:MAG: sodium:calcium antiporter [Chloroflexi bacterium]|nr:sodium:calcium antiporter [Chloroflexota bacterium]